MANRIEIGDQKIIVKVEFEGFSWERDLLADLTVTPDQINEVLLKAPATVAYWQTAYAKVKNRANTLATLLKRKEAELDRTIRESMNTAAAESGLKGQKAKILTEGDIKAQIIIDLGFMEIEDEFLKTREAEQTLKAACDSLHELRSTLIQLSANLRAEGYIAPKSDYVDKVDRLKKKAIDR